MSVEALATKDVEAGGLSADPEIGFAVFEDGEDGVGTDSWLELRVGVDFV